MRAPARVPATAAKRGLETEERPRAWTVPYGKEFWRTAVCCAETPKSGNGGGLPNGIDLGEVMMRVSHAITDFDSAGNPMVRGKVYSATFDAAAVAFRTGGQEPEVEARFRTRAVRVGNRELTLDGLESAWAIKGNTAQRLIASQARLVEHGEARREGMELTWVIGTRPGVNGDLEIGIEVDGLAVVGESEKGVHFGNTDGNSRVRFGKAVLVDAAGKRTELAMEAKGKTIWIRAPGNVLAAAEFPVAIDPIISAEFGMDNPVIGLAAHDQDSPKVASNGEDFLVVWTDKRKWADSDVIGARVTRNGVVLDAEGLRLGVGENDQNYPAVASSANEYLVTWTEMPAAPGLVLGIRQGTIIGKRVKSDGTVLDAVAISISGDTVGVVPAVASDGTNFLVSWGAAWTNVPVAISSAVVSEEGAVGPIRTLTENAQATSRVASNGKSYFEVWSEGGDVKGLRLALDGSPLDASSLIIASSAASPDVCSDGTNYFAVWNPSETNNIRGARISASGLLMDENAIVIANASDSGGEPAVASAGGNYFVAWRYVQVEPTAYHFSVRGRRVSGAGQVLDGNAFFLGQNVPNDSYPPVSIASNGSEYFSAWVSLDVDNRDVRGTLVTLQGELIGTAGFAVSTGRNNEELPKVASNGENYLVVWEDSRDLSGTTDIYGVRLDRKGATLDPNGIAIARAVERQFHPAVASDGTNYLAAWSDDRTGTTHVFATGITRDGIVLTPEGIEVDPSGNSQLNCSIASDGKGYLVVWEDVSARGRALAGTGAFLGPATKYSGLTAGRTPAVASNGTDYLVLWSTTDIYGMRVNHLGAVQSPTIAINNVTGDQINPVVASDGGNYFVAWQDLRSARHWEIYGTRVAADGPEDAGHLLVTDAQSPALASNGVGYCLAWERLFYGVDAMRLNTAGFAESAVMHISDSVSGQGSPAVSGLGEDILVVYHKPDETGARRVFGKVVTEWTEPQWTSQDIGAVTALGEVEFNLPDISVRGAGAGIGGTSDAFHFLWQTLDGDGQITARVLAFDPDLPSAEGGVMMREDLSANARYAFMGYSRPTQGVVFDRRRSAGELNVETRAGGAAWMRLARMGDTVIAYQSDDGASWTVVGFATMSYGASVKIGLASTGNPDGPGVITTFDRVSVGGLSFTATVGAVPKIYATQFEPTAPFKIMVAGDPGTYEFQTTTNFSGWLGVGSVVNSYGVGIFTEENTASGGARFYRVRKL